MDKLADATAIASGTPKGRRWLQSLGQKIDGLLHPLPAQEEQRVADETRLRIDKEEQGWYMTHQLSPYHV